MTVELAKQFLNDQNIGDDSGKSYLLKMAKLERTDKMRHCDFIAAKYIIENYSNDVDNETDPTYLTCLQNAKQDLLEVPTKDKKSNLFTRIFGKGRK